MATASKLDILRTVRFSPYRKGMGPTFTLKTWDTGRTDSYGKSRIGYRLTMRGTCGHAESAKTTCGRCHRSWCDDCYPAPSAMCHWCNGNYNNVTGKCNATKWGKPLTTVLFEGEDFCCAPSYAIDGDQCIASLMGFLTLRPGDTDREYFADYTPEQLEYCSHHAESLSCEVMNRFGEG